MLRDMARRVLTVCGLVLIGLQLAACNTTKATIDTTVNFFSSTSPNDLFTGDGLVREEQKINLFAGVAYEILRFSGTNPDGTLARILATPGLWLQRLTTGPPDEDQIEVAIASLITALDEETLSEVLGRGGVPSFALEVRRAAMVGDPL